MPFILILDDPTPIRVPQCDFCNSRQPVWRWRTKSFEMPELGWASQGDWAACDECNKIMLANNWVALLERSAVTSPHWFDVGYSERMIIKNFIMLQHKLFRQNLLVGEPEAI